MRRRLALAVLSAVSLFLTASYLSFAQEDVEPASSRLAVYSIPLSGLVSDGVAAPPPRPTATPTPTPAPTAAPGKLGWESAVRSIFGSAWLPAMRILWCESSGDQWATGGQGEKGLFQIHPAYHPDSTYDVMGNLRAAHRISAGGTNWSAWTHGPARAAGAACEPWKPGYDSL